MQSESTPWHGRAFLSVQETAHVLARSPDWVRERIEMGDLEGARYSKGAPLVVAVASVLRFIATAERVRPPQAATHRHLTLVASNDIPK